MGGDVGDLQVINKALELGKFEASPVGLVVKGKPTYDEWASCGQVLSHIEKGRLWWLGDWLRYGEQNWGEMYSQAMDETGAAYQSCADAKWVCECFAEFSRRREKLSFAHHREVAPLSKEEQELWLNTAEQQGLSKQELREQIRQSKKLIAPPLPAGTYSVIYADPPWPVESMVLDKWESPLSDKYPTMTLEEIENLKVPEIAAQDCSLFLWTTHTFLPNAFDVIEKWGFKYHACITWDKGGGWTLCGIHRRTEFCLFAYKGTINLSQEGDAIPTLISEAKREHSKKPDILYEYIEKKTPKPRIELFARKKRTGWAVWGNQV
jgi:N6-adenosine-specific RNA methylase IME4